MIFDSFRRWLDAGGPLDGELRCESLFFQRDRCDLDRGHEGWHVHTERSGDTVSWPNNRVAPVVAWHTIDGVS